MAIIARERVGGSGKNKDRQEELLAVILARQLPNARLCLLLKFPSYNKPMYKKSTSYIASVLRALSYCSFPLSKNDEVVCILFSFPYDTQLVQVQPV